MASRPIAPPLAALLLTIFSPVAVRAASSNSLMDVTPDGGRLLVANSDNGSVTVVDIAEKKALREIKVGDKPEGVAWVGKGPFAVVTVYRDDLVAFVDTETGKVVEKLKVANEPYGIVTDKDGKRAWVTHEYPGTVSEIDLADRKVTREMK